MIKNIAIKKSEMAVCYFPESTLKVATRHLMRWINGCPPLMEELQLTGYYPLQKVFTARQAALIYYHLGAPG